MKTRPRPIKYRKKNRKKKPESAPGPCGVTLRPHQVLIRPLVTEKGTHQSARYNSYSFQVAMTATKGDIKDAVQQLFNVRVEAVNTQIRHGKKRRWKQTMGQLADTKRAIVTLHEEDKIEFF